MNSLAGWVGVNAQEANVFPWRPAAPPDIAPTRTMEGLYGCKIIRCTPHRNFGYHCRGWLGGRDLKGEGLYGRLAEWKRSLRDSAAIEGNAFIRFHRTRRFYGTFVTDNERAREKGGGSLPMVIEVYGTLSPCFLGRCGLPPSLRLYFCGK